MDWRENIVKGGSRHDWLSSVCQLKHPEESLAKSELSIYSFCALGLKGFFFPLLFRSTFYAVRLVHPERALKGFRFTHFFSCNGISKLVRSCTERLTYSLGHMTRLL